MTIERPTGYCDFCRATDVAWIYPALDFVMEMDGWASEGGWAACETCAQLIESENHQALADRSIEAYQAPGPIKVILRVRIMELHDQFRQHRTVPRIPWKPSDQGVIREQEVQPHS